MSSIQQITAAAQQIKTQNGLYPISAELHAALIGANQNGTLEVTADNANYCSFQGAWSTPEKMINCATHFEFYSADTIMLKQGGKKMRAFKIKNA